MYYYKVNMVGDGTEDNEFRPNIPNDVSFVWSDSVCPICGTYIMASNELINDIEQITDLSTACDSRNLNINDVEKWFVGSN